MTLRSLPAFTASLALVLATAAAAQEQPRFDGPPVAEKDVHASGVPGFAVVDLNGVLQRKSNAKTSTRVSTGSYDVEFNSNIRGCAYVVSLGQTGSQGFPPVGYAAVVGRTGSIRGVYVQTYDATGVLADQPFHLIVSC